MTGMDDLVTWLRGELNTDERGLHEWLSNLPSDSGAADWVRQWLAEVDAKRRIIELAGGIHGYEEAVDGEWGDGDWPDDATDRPSAQLLRLLALPLADRPGYRDEWRP